MRKYGFCLLLLIMHQSLHVEGMWQTVKDISNVLINHIGFPVYATQLTQDTDCIRYNGGYRPDANGCEYEEEDGDEHTSLITKPFGTVLFRGPFFVVKRERRDATRDNSDGTKRSVSYVATTVHVMIPDLILTAGLLSYGAWWWYKRKCA